MTVLLYYSIFSNLSEEEIVEIDRQVANNRETVCICVNNLAANGKKTTRKVVFIIALASGVWFSNLESAEAIGLPMPPSAMLEVQPTLKWGHTLKKPVIEKLVPRKPDRISYKYISKSKEEILLLLYATDPRLSSSPQVLKIVTDLRGGDWGLLCAVAFLGVIILIFASMGEGFVPNNPNGDWIWDRPNPFQPPTVDHKHPPYYDRFLPRRTPGYPTSASTLRIYRPTAMPHQEFVDLTKSERRNLPHTNDMKIIQEGRPELVVGFYQSKYKVGDHGAVHNLPYTIKANGGTKTEKTDQNVLKMMQSIVNMPNREGVEWFEDGTYQGSTNRGFEAIHIYDPINRVIAVFKKSTGKFVTTCQLDKEEDTELKATGNFGGREGWYSGQVKNLPPQQTAVNKFESDVTGITPISPMNENSSPGFTPTSTFESDVMGITPITPIDNSQLDKP
jgi:hypothetical protein